MPARAVVASVEAEFRRHKQLAEGAMRQLTPPQLGQAAGATDNSVATIAWHIAGNLRSRFTDFLTADGEKPWRDRDSEFLTRDVSPGELLDFWEQGWAAWGSAVSPLTDQDLARIVRIRNQPLSVLEALHRSLAHVSYHVGQIVFVAKALRGAQWQWLTIPPGKSADYNQNPTRERPPKTG